METFFFFSLLIPLLVFFLFGAFILRLFRRILQTGREYTGSRTSGYRRQVDTAARGLHTSSLFQGSQAEEIQKLLKMNQQEVFAVLEPLIPHKYKLDFLRIKNTKNWRGPLLMLLHRPDVWDSVRQLFRRTESYAQQASRYLDEAEGSFDSQLEEELGERVTDEIDYDAIFETFETYKSDIQDTSALYDFRALGEIPVAKPIKRHSRKSRKNNKKQHPLVKGIIAKEIMERPYR